MTESSRCFAGAAGDTREYTAAEFAEMMLTAYGRNGVVTRHDASGNLLQVVERAGNPMGVDVDTGLAVIQGYWYKNTAKVELTIEAAEAQNRIDRIILRLDLSAGVRLINAKVLKGTAGASPVAPTLTQDATTWEISLAQVAVDTGVANIYQADITDERPGIPSGAIAYTIDGGADVIATGNKGYVVVPYSCNIVGWTLLGDQATGNIVVDISGCTYANFPVMTSIAGTEKPTLTGVQKNQDNNLTTWTTNLSEGDILCFYVDSCTTKTRANLILSTSR